MDIGSRLLCESCGLRPFVLGCCQAHCPQHYLKRRHPRDVVRHDVADLCGVLLDDRLSLRNSVPRAGFASSIGARSTSGHL
jgi:hypothetical protein